MKARIHITLKKGVLDPQGKAIGHALDNLGFDDINDVRQGKLIEIELGNPASEDEARATVKTMCEKLLANPVMEDFDIKLVA